MFFVFSWNFFILILPFSFFFFLVSDLSGQRSRIVPMFNSGSGFADETVESMVGMLGLR